MKKLFYYPLFLALSLTIFTCSSDDESGGNTFNAYFNFQANGYDFSVEESFEGIDLCWSVDLMQNGEVTILSSYNHPIEELVYCGVVIDLSDNHIGNHNDAYMTISMGNDAVLSENFQVELTDNGSYYIGNFNGEFTLLLDGNFSTVQGSGAFKVPLLEL